MVHNTQVFNKRKASSIIHSNTNNALVMHIVTLNPALGSPKQVSCHKSIVVVKRMSTLNCLHSAIYYVPWFVLVEHSVCHESRHANIWLIKIRRIFLHTNIDHVPHHEWATKNILPAKPPEIPFPSFLVALLMIRVDETYSNFCNFHPWYLFWFFYLPFNNQS